MILSKIDLPVELKRISKIANLQNTENGHFSISLSNVEHFMSNAVRNHDILHILLRDMKEIIE